MAERIAMVWPLTVEAASLSKRHNVEQRLQRHVTKLIRNKRASGRTKDLAGAEALESLKDTECSSPRGSE